MNPTTVALAPFSALYGAAVRARLALYRGGVLKRLRVGAPVISVGNITAGGTGKTPMVEWISRAAAREGRRPCVLTRGYGRRDEGARAVVSDGTRLLAEAPEAGDEPRMLAENLLGVASVVCDADRASAARWAAENLGAEVFILDDGFQHLRLARDLDVVTVDATSPWGGGRLLPRGRLREPLRGLARADCVVITRADLADDLEALREQVRRLTVGKAVILEARARTKRVSELFGAAAHGDEGEAVVPRPAAALCATGNPRAFFEHLRRGGHDLAFTRAFADHHNYTQADLDAVVREAERLGARALLTTAKDAVKLRALNARLPAYVVGIELEINEEERLVGLIRGAIMRSEEAAAAARRFR